MTEADADGRRQGHEALALSAVLLPAVVLAALPILAQATICYDEPDQPWVCSRAGLTVATVWWAATWGALTAALVWIGIRLRAARVTEESPWRVSRGPLLLVVATAVLAAVLFPILR